MLINGVAIEEIKNLPVYNSNFLYADTRNQILTKHKLFQLDIDIGENTIPFLLEGEHYTFLSQKLIKHELEDGSIQEIPIMNSTIPPLKNYVIYKQQSNKFVVIQKWLNEFSLARFSGAISSTRSWQAGQGGTHLAILLKIPLRDFWQICLLGSIPNSH